MALCIVALIFLFGAFTDQYKRNTSYESAGHLVEINRQVKTCVEESMDSDRNFTRSIADSIRTSSFASEADLLAYLRAQRDIWGVDSICVYTSDGICLDQDGIARSTDRASRYAADTIRNGESFTISESTTEYGIPVDAETTVRGSPIVVVSVVRNLDTLIDDMNIEAFDGQSSIYLTRQNGVKISQSSSGRQVYNIVPLFDEGSLTCLSGSGLTLADAMAEGRECVFLYVDASDEYVVATPVDAVGDTWYLFYLVPSKTVDATMDDFASQLSVLAISVILAFMILTLAFALVFRYRSKRYDSDLQNREHLFNLLVSQTDNAFALFSDKQECPIYLSSNAPTVLGSALPRWDMEAKRPQLESEGSLDVAAVNRVNRAIKNWDGKRDFASDSIPVGEAGGLRRFIMLRLCPVQGADHELIGIAQDVTHEREREDELRNALVLADSANRAKTKFLSSMSHDIRTPMNAIVNMTQFTVDDIDDRDKALEHLDVIRSSSEHLLQLINNVLDMSRVESGKLTFSSDPFDIHDAVSDICRIIKPLCDGKKHVFTCADSNIKNPRVLGDVLRLDQVLINLLNNAVKFTPEGGHLGLVVSELPSLKPDTATFRFRVTDDGIGIDEDLRKSIFDPFTRAENKDVGSIEGSGLGLSISRNFVQAMGGSIGVESAPGKGSTFTVELFFPIDKESSKPDDAVPEDDSDMRFDGMRALLVEDNAVNLMVATTLLTGWGFEVDEAVDGEQALNRFAAEDAPAYDIIFMDVQMPIMDGYRATKAIRSTGRPGADTVPIIAMTANVFAEDVERARAAGMSGHVGKPIDPSDLRREVARQLGMSTGSGDSADSR